MFPAHTPKRTRSGPGIHTVLGLGTGLFLAGNQLSIIFTLLGGLGAIGAATLTAVGGGRRLMTILIEAAVRSSTGR